MKKAQFSFQLSQYPNPPNKKQISTKATESLMAFPDRFHLALYNQSGP